MVARLLQPPPPFALPPPLCPAYALAPPAAPTRSHLVEAQATWRAVGLVCLVTLCALLVLCCRPPHGS